MFDPDLMAWTDLAFTDPPAAGAGDVEYRMSPGMGSVGGKVYLYGGRYFEVSATIQAAPSESLSLVERRPESLTPQVCVHIRTGCPYPTGIVGLMVKVQSLTCCHGQNEPQWQLNGCQVLWEVERAHSCAR